MRLHAASLLLGVALLACSPTPASTPSPTPIPSPTPLDIEGDIAFVSDRGGSYQIHLMNADGTGIRQLTEGPGENAKPAWSPDGSQIAFTSDRDGNQEIYIMQSDGSGQTNFSDHPGDDRWPAWSPDGSAIAFVANIEGFDQLTVLGLDGSLRVGLRGRVGYPQAAMCCVTWYSDTGVTFTSYEDGVGTIISYSLAEESVFIHRDADQVGLSECCQAYSPLDDSFLMISLESGVEQVYWEGGPDGGSVQLTYHAQGSHGPGWSPDGQWIVYYAKETGGFEVFTMRTDDLEPVNLTNHPSNDLEPAWRPSP